MQSVKQTQQLNQPLLTHAQSVNLNINRNTLFLAIYELPLSKQQIKGYEELKNKIIFINTELSSLQKTNPQEIQKVCISNQRLIVVAKFLRECSAIFPDNPKEIHFVPLIINMFSMMMVSNKVIDYLSKLMVPFSVYRILVKIFFIKSTRNQAARKIYSEIIRRQQTYQCLKLMGKWLSSSSKTFPRSFANFMDRLLVEFPKVEKQQKNIDKEKQQILLITEKAYRQNERISEIYTYITSIACELVRNNLKLAAESGTLIVMYKKAIEGELSWEITQQLIDIIVNHMNYPNRRAIIISSLDLGKAFAIFTNVDSRKENKTEEKIDKNSCIIEILLSSWPTLVYFIRERLTLKHFVASLRTKSQKQISIVNERIFSKLLNRALKYDRKKMQQSQNDFGLHSNYLNLRSLIIVSFFLENTILFELFKEKDPKGQIFRNIGKLSLMYFPITFEKDKNNKEIILNIPLTSLDHSVALQKNFINWVSYTNQCVINYQFQKYQFIDELSSVCKIPEMKDAPEHILTQLHTLLSKFKQNVSLNFEGLMFQFYKAMIQASYYIPWKPEHLKITKFLSEIIGQLVTNEYRTIYEYCLKMTEDVFQNLPKYFYRSLAVTFLNDMGKYFGHMPEIHNLIFNYCDDPNYSFYIGRILLNIDFDKKQNSKNMTQRHILEKIIEGNACQQLILQAIQIIKHYSAENDENSEWGIELICEKVLYLKSQEILNSAVEFCEEIVINHKYYHKFIHKVRFDDIAELNMRKRAMYMLLRSESGIDIIEKYSPNFIRNQLELWFKEGLNFLKDYAQYISRQSKRYAFSKDSLFINIGNQFENRYKLIYLPWNIQINKEHYIAIASYKPIKQKIKLTIKPNIEIDDAIILGMYEMGSVLPFQMERVSPLVIKKQQIMKNYEKNKIKESKEIKKFAISKDKITFIMNFYKNVLVLEQLIINIPLSKDVYRPLLYPINFINLLSKTTAGMDILRKHKIIQACIKLLKESKDIQLVKGALEILGLLFLSNKLETLEKIEIYEIVIMQMDQNLNSEIKEVVVWVITIMGKDDDFRKKLKELKSFLVLESRYCGWICYPQFYGNKFDYYDQKIKRFHYSLQFLPDKPVNTGFALIQAILEFSSNEKVEARNQKQKDRKKEAYEYYKKPDNRELAWNSNLFAKTFTYISIINFELDKIKEIFDLYSEYLSSEQFQKDFPNGFHLP